MKQIPDVLTAHLRQLQEEAPWVWLYEVQVPTTPPTRLRLTNYGQSIAYGISSAGVPLTYDAAPIVHGDLEESAEGDQPEFQVQFGNSGLDLMQKLEDWDGLEGQPARVQLVNSAELDAPPVLEFDAEVLHTRVSADRVTMSLGLDSLTGIQVPPERFSRLHCRFQYGGPRCGARIDVPGLVAAVPSCARTLNACEDVGAAELAEGLPVIHPLRFGGWLGIPRRSRK